MAEKKVRSLINDVKPDPAVAQLRTSHRELKPIMTTPAPKTEEKEKTTPEVESQSEVVEETQVTEPTTSQQDSLSTEISRETKIKPVIKQEERQNNNYSSNQIASNGQTAPMPLRGRPVLHTDPRYRSDMPVKISGYNKSRISALTDSKLGSVTMDQAITHLIDFYLEKGLSKDEVTLVDTMTAEYMENLKQQPKYRGYFQ